MTARSSALIEEEQGYEQDLAQNDSELRSAFDSPIGAKTELTIQLKDEQSASTTAVPGVHGGAQSEDKARRWMWGFLIALAALQTYFVQALLAALFLFTLAFAVFAVIAFAFYVANRASQASLERVEPVARVAARAGRRTYGFIEHVSKKPFRRPHSETAQ